MTDAFAVKRLDVTNVGALLLRLDERKLTMLHGQCEAPELLPCDPWSVHLLAWIWAVCGCDFATYAYDAICLTGTVEQVSEALSRVRPTIETCERVRVAWLASRGVHVPSLASAPPLSVADAASILGVDVAALTAQAKRGEVRTVKYAGRRMVPRDEVARLIEAQPEERMSEDDIDAILDRCRAS